MEENIITAGENDILDIYGLVSLNTSPVTLYYSRGIRKEEEKEACEFRGII